MKLQSQRVERRKWEKRREGGGGRRTKELEEGKKNKCDIRLQGQSAWECRTGGRVGLWAGSCTVVDTIRQGRQGPAQSTRMGPNQHQGTANHSDYQRARLMHKTSIRVVDGNGWRRNSYAGSRRQLSLVGGPDGDAFFYGQGGGCGRGPLGEEPTGTLDSHFSASVFALKRRHTGNEDGARGRMEEARACRTMIAAGSTVDRKGQIPRQDDTD